MNKCFICFYSMLLILFSCLSAHAQDDDITIRIGKLTRVSYYNDQVDDSLHTYYITSEARKIERFIKNGNWLLVDKRYTPYNSKTLPMIDSCLLNSLKRTLSEKEVEILNSLGAGNVFMSNFYVFVNSKKRFVKLMIWGCFDKFLSKAKIYKIIHLYSKCKLPIHPVAGQLKEKEYYITGASVSRIE